MPTFRVFEGESSVHTPHVDRAWVIQFKVRGGDMYIIYQLFLGSKQHTRTHEGFTFALRAHTAAEGRNASYFHLFPIKTCNHARDTQ